MRCAAPMWRSRLCGQKTQHHCTQGIVAGRRDERLYADRSPVDFDRLPTRQDRRCAMERAHRQACGIAGAGTQWACVASRVDQLQAVIAGNQPGDHAARPVKGGPLAGRGRSRVLSADGRRQTQIILDPKFQATVVDTSACGGPFAFGHVCAHVPVSHAFGVILGTEFFERFGARSLL